MTWTDISLNVAWRLLLKRNDADDKGASPSGRVVPGGLRDPETGGGTWMRCRPVSLGRVAVEVVGRALPVELRFSADTPSRCASGQLLREAVMDKGGD